LSLDFLLRVGPDVLDDVASAAKTSANRCQGIYLNPGKLAESPTTWRVWVKHGRDEYIRRASGLTAPVQFVDKRIPDFQRRLGLLPIGIVHSVFLESMMMYRAPFTSIERVRRCHLGQAADCTQK